MLMRYHWGHAPGHLYMYQGHTSHSTTSSNHLRDNSRTNDPAQAQDYDDGVEYEQDITCDEYAQMGSDSDGADSDFDADSGSDHGSNRSGTTSGRSEGSFEDNDDDDWEVQSMYED
jgi:hypothetical protein